MAQHLSLSAYSVEKHRNSDIVIFRQKAIKPRSQMRLFARRRVMPPERRKANLAEPHADKSLSACAAKYFASQAKNGVFQQNRPRADLGAMRSEGRLPQSSRL
jgi:hypothetical protein